MAVPYGGATLPELHSILYLACLLSVYDGESAAKWGYEFVSSGASSPFSQDVLAAVNALLASGKLRGDLDDRLLVTPTGETLLEYLSESPRFSARLEYLGAAVNAANALPLPAVRAAIASEPQLARAVALKVPDRLLDEVGLSALHDDFAVLEGQLGRDVDLAMPAIVWLSFLLEDSDGALGSASGSTQ